jgi:hypothetical protein
VAKSKKVTQTTASGELVNQGELQALFDEWHAMVRGYVEDYMIGDARVQALQELDEEAAERAKKLHVRFRGKQY